MIDSMFPPEASGLFLEAANLSDFSDHHSIIYGHNMKDGSMFGSLKKYQDKEYWIDNQYFTLYTTNAFRRFQIVGVQIVDQNSEVYTVGFLPDQEYEEFIKQLSKGLLYDTGLEVTKEDYLLSLSTCTYSNEKRLVIHAKQID